MNITEQLRKSGKRLTDARKTVAAWIEETDGIFSQREILAANNELDSVSVYRTLELLKNEDLIHPVMSVHGEVHYEKHEPSHYHAVCTECEKTECVKNSVVKLKSEPLKYFRKLHHTLVFTGVCVSCT